MCLTKSSQFDFTISWFHFLSPLSSFHNSGSNMFAFLHILVVDRPVLVFDSFCSGRDTIMIRRNSNGKETLIIDARDRDLWFEFETFANDVDSRHWRFDDPCERQRKTQAAFYWFHAQCSYRKPRNSMNTFASTLQTLQKASVHRFADIVTREWLESIVPYLPLLSKLPNSGWVIQ